MNSGIAVYGLETIERSKDTLNSITWQYRMTYCDLDDAVAHTYFND